MTPDPNWPLLTDRLRLRLYRTEDAAASLAYYGDPEVARYLLEGPWTPATAEEKIAERVARTGLAEGRNALALVIERDGTVVGDVALWVSDQTGECAEIGWVLHPDAQGHGYATEAVRAVLDLAFGHYRLHRVAAQLDARNTASARLCTRVGMAHEAHLRQDWYCKGEWTDTAIYGVLAADWARS